MYRVFLDKEREVDQRPFCVSASGYRACPGRFVRSLRENPKSKGVWLLSTGYLYNLRSRKISKLCDGVVLAVR